MALCPSVTILIKVSSHDMDPQKALLLLPSWGIKGKIKVNHMKTCKVFVLFSGTKRMAV